jgi:hypothetical protein
VIPLGLTGAETRAMRAALTQSNRVRVRAAALNLDGEHLADLTPYLIGGQVDVDGTADVTRSCTLKLSDPRRRLPFDSDHPAATALFLDRMVHVSYDVLVAGKWQPIPVFTGPVTKLDRDGDEVSVEGQGKEVLFLGAAWRPLTLHKGMRKTAALTRVMHEANPAYRETRLDIPDLTSRLPRHISLSPESVPWHVARRIAWSTSRQFFYDGRGRARLRRRPATVGFRFTGSGHVTSPPQVSYSGDVVNAARVIGAIPKGAKRHVQGRYIAPHNHPLSPYRIGRFAMPDGQITRDDSIKTSHEADALAKRLVYDGLLQSVDVSFDAVPVPFLEPGDLCHVNTDDGSVTFRLDRFSLPLDVSGSMSVGYTRRVSLQRTRRHRK